MAWLSDPTMGTVRQLLINRINMYHSNDWHTKDTQLFETWASLDLFPNALQKQLETPQGKAMSNWYKVKQHLTQSQAASIVLNKL